MQQGFQGPARVKNVMDNPKLHLTAKNEDGKNASLKLAFFNGNPRLTVWTNVPNDKDKGKIDAKLDAVWFGVFLELLRKAADFVPTDAEPEWSRHVQNKIPRPGQQFVPGVPAQTITTSQLDVGQDKQGVWVAVTAYQRPKIKFYFTNSVYHSLVHRTGESVSSSEVSVIMARSYLRRWEAMVDHLAATTYEHKERPAPGAQGGQGGYNRGGQGGGQQGGNQWNQNKPADQAPAGGGGRNNFSDMDFDPDLIQ